jgi:hypothetical protein
MTDQDTNFKINEINIASENIISVSGECEMNKYNVKYDPNNQYVNAEECPGCKTDGICKYCLDTCHRAHKHDKKSKQAIPVNRVEFECACAKKNHQVDALGSEQEGEISGGKCVPAQICSLLNLSFYQRHTGQTLCRICYWFESKHLDSIEEDVSLIPAEEGVECSGAIATVPRNEVFKALFESTNDEDYNEIMKTKMDTVKLLHLIFSKKEFLGYFFKHSIDVKNKLSDFFVSKNFSTRSARKKITVESEQEQKDNFSLLYSHQLKNIWKILQIDIDYLDMIYSFDFLKKMFKVKITQKDELCDIKIACLKYFNTFRIIPYTGLHYQKILTNAIRNVTPLHRYLFRRPLQELFEKIQIPRDEFLIFVDTIYSSFMEIMKYGCEPENARNYFKEYSTIIKTIFSYNFKINDYVLIEKYMDQLISMKPYVEKNIQENYLTLVRHLVYAINDYKFANFSQGISTDEKKITPEEKKIFEEAKLAFQKSDQFIKLVKVILEQKNVKFYKVEYLYDILLLKNDIYVDSLHALLNCNRNYCLDEMEKIYENDEEFLPPHEVRGDEDEYEDETDQTEDVSYRLIPVERVLTLAAAVNEEKPKELKDMKEIELQNLNKEPAKAAIADKEKEKTQEKKTIVLFKNQGEKDYFLGEEFLGKWEELKEKIFEIKTVNNLNPEKDSSEKNLYYFEHYLEKIRDYLEELSGELNNSLNLSNTNEKILKQIWMFRNGVFEILIQSNEFLKHFLNPHIHQDDADTEDGQTIHEISDRIISLIFENLNKLVEENSFLASSLFNEKILSQKCFYLKDKLIIKYHVKWLDAIKKDNFKMDFTEYIDKFLKDIFMPKLIDNNSAFKSKFRHHFQLTYNHHREVTWDDVEKLDEKFKNDIEYNHDKEGEIPELLQTRVFMSWMSGYQSSQEDLAHLVAFSSLLSRMLRMTLDRSREKVHCEVFKIMMNAIEGFVKPLYEDFVIKSEPEFNGPGSKTDFLSLILQINKIFINLSAEYSYLISPHLPYDLIHKIVSNPKLEPDYRTSFTKLYVKYFVQLPHKVYTNFNEFTRQFMKSSSNNFNLLYDSRGDDAEAEVLLVPLKNFRVNFSNFREKYFDKDPRAVLQYFLHVILKPSCEYLYRVSYFNTTIDNKTKYKIYQGVILFIKCYKFILEIIYEYKYITEEYFKLFKTFFKMEPEQEKDLNLFFLQQNAKLDKTIKVFDRDEIHLLDHIEVLEKFNEFINTFNFRLKIVKTFREKGDYKEFFKTVNYFAYKYDMLERNYEEQLITLLIEKATFEEDEDQYLIKSNLLSNVLRDVSIPDKGYFPEDWNDDLRNYMEIISSWKLSFHLKLIVKIVRHSPSFYQELFLNSPNQNSIIEKALIYKIMGHLFPFYSQFIFIDTNKALNNSFILCSKRILKFLTLLCKNFNIFFVSFISHLKIAQTARGSRLEFSQYTMNILYCIINDILHYSKKEHIVHLILGKSNENAKAKNFTPIYSNIFSLYKELIQSQVQDALPKKDENFKIFTEQTKKILIQLPQNQRYVDFLCEFLTFIYTYSFQFDYNFEIVPSEVQTLLIYLYEHLLAKYLKKSSSVSQDKPKELPIVDSHERFLEAMTSNEKIFKDPFFYIFSQLFLIITNTGENFKNGAYDRLMQNMINFSASKDLSDMNKNQLNLREIYRLFNKIIKSVEIVINPKIEKFEANDGYKSFLEEIPSQIKTIYNEGDIIKSTTTLKSIEKETKEVKGGLKRVHFQITSEGVFITQDDVDKFIDQAPFDKEHTKLDALLEYYNYIKTIISVRKKLYNSKSTILSAVLKINYYWVEYFSIFMSAVVNLIIIASIYSSTEVTVDPFYFLSFYCSLTHLVVLFIALCTLVPVEIYKLNVYNKTVPQQNQLDLFRFVTSFLPKSSYVIFWNFILGVIAISNHNLNFVYALQLFSIFSIFPTMRSVLTAVEDKWREFLSAGLLILILLLFYAFVSVIYFQDKFNNEDINVRILFNKLGKYLRFSFTLLPQFDYIWNERRRWVWILNKSL